MNIEQEIQMILDRNFTRGNNANALKELLVLYNVVGRSEQLKPKKECYKSGETCGYECSGLCKESC